MYQTSCRCMRWLGCGTSTYSIRIGLNENSKFQIVRRSVASLARSKIVDVLGESLGSYSRPGIDSGNSTSGRGPLNISSDSGLGGIVVTTPGANCRWGTAC